MLTSLLPPVLHHAANHIELPPPTPGSLEGFTHLLLQNEIPFKTTTEYLSAADALGIVTIMNPSPLPTAEQTREFPWGKLTWLIVNDGEARDLLTSVGEPHTTDAIELVLPEGAPEDQRAIRSAHAVGSKLASHPTFKGTNVICTLGSVGLIAFVPLIQGVGKSALYLPAAKLDGPVVDTTGAGDCFTGYFVSGLMAMKQGQQEDLVNVLSTSVNVRPFQDSPVPNPNLVIWTHRQREFASRGKEQSIVYRYEKKSSCGGVDRHRSGRWFAECPRKRVKISYELNPKVPVCTWAPLQ